MSLAASPRDPAAKVHDFTGAARWRASQHGLVLFTNVVFDPDYARNGVFYTIHMEDPSTAAPAAPRAGVVPGLDLTGYTTTAAIPTPTVGGKIDREAVLIEWTDKDPETGAKRSVRAEKFARKWTFSVRFRRHTARRRFRRIRRGRRNTTR